MNDPWHRLRSFTQARIAQGHAGCGLPTTALLDFQLAHAFARDAIHHSWDIKSFSEAVKEMGLEPLCLATPVADRVQYLQRPDLGRRLDPANRQMLLSRVQPAVDVALIISNGLSSIAVERHGARLLQEIVAAFDRMPMVYGPTCLVPDARVALADEVGALLKARLSVIVVGERPGLSAADSLGVYLTYAPQVGRTDAERNCISNIRPPDGLSYEAAAAKLAYLSYEALQMNLSGVALKDEMPSHFLG
jgi:ethanolamine ammonia-lyase small subunit